MKNIVNTLSYLLVFAFLFSCQCKAQESVSDRYLARMVQLTNTLDSLITQTDNVNCDTLSQKLTILIDSLSENDSLLHTIGVSVNDRQPPIESCGGGYAKFWLFPKGGLPCNCDWDNSEKFDTKNFGTCFFERREGSIPHIVKNGIVYGYLLSLTLQSSEKFKNKYTPVVYLQVFLPAADKH
jgi:hypothetical protein